MQLEDDSYQLAPGPCRDALLHRVHVFVPAARKIDEQRRRRPELAREPFRVRDCVRRLERRQDAFEPRELLERTQRLVVGDIRVLGAAECAQPRMFRKRIW